MPAKCTIPVDVSHLNKDERLASVFWVIETFGHDEISIFPPQQDNSWKIYFATEKAANWYRLMYG